MTDDVSLRDVRAELAVCLITAVTWLGGSLVVEHPGLQGMMFTYGTLAAIFVYGAVHDPSILSRAEQEIEPKNDNTNQ